MNDKPVHEIMVPLADYPCICETHTLREAIEEMTKTQILRNERTTLARVALVFDVHYRALLGTLRRRDIMRGLEPRFLLSESMEYERKLFSIEVDPNLAELSSDKVIAQMRQRANRRVSDFMMPIPTTIGHGDHLMKAIYEMVDHNTSLLPVTKEGTVVGVVRSVDLLHEIALIINN
jgi:CBS domain-containing protein